MGKIRPFRYWYYFRQGYHLYFAFVFAALNTLVVTYFLAIERAPVLKEVFPTFAVYAFVLIAIGTPSLILAGYLHYKRIPAFKSEQEVTVESNPYIYKLQPGYQKHVSFPQTLLTNKILLRLAKSQNLISDEEIKHMEDIQKNLEKLIGGGYVGVRKGKLPFESSETISDSSEKS